MIEGKFEGEAFIVTSVGWACSNSVTFDHYKDSIRDDNDKIVAIKKTQILSVNGLFGKLEEGQEVRVVFSPDNDNRLFGFLGNVKKVAGKKAILNILTKTDKVKEILSNITFKN